METNFMLKISYDDPFKLAKFLYNKSKLKIFFTKTVKRNL